MSVATKGLNEDTSTLKTLHQDCLEKSQDFEAETKSRGEELKALSHSQIMEVLASQQLAAQQQITVYCTIKDHVHYHQKLDLI